MHFLVLHGFVLDVFDLLEHRMALQIGEAGIGGFKLGFQHIGTLGVGLGQGQGVTAGAAGGIGARQGIVGTAPGIVGAGPGVIGASTGIGGMGLGAVGRGLG